MGWVTVFWNKTGPEKSTENIRPKRANFVSISSVGGIGYHWCRLEDLKGLQTSTMARNDPHPHLHPHLHAMNFNTFPQHRYKWYISVNKERRGPSPPPRTLIQTQTGPLPPGGLVKETPDPLRMVCIRPQTWNNLQRQYYAGRMTPCPLRPPPPHSCPFSNLNFCKFYFSS